MEEIDDEDDIPRNVAPTNRSRIIELSDASTDDEDGDEDEAPEESEEAELGQLFP
jgi:hypothetical protein